ncbi:Protein MAIN-LIKE 2 [Glycine max]|nr:Protein MAIN-LIKE 2 [Glycine max]
MVRTRGLGRALDRVIGRALWREDNHDSDDAFQQRRLTHPHEVVVVAEDASHMDDVAEEVFQHVEEVGVDAQGFPGGSHDTSMLVAYVDHVAVIIWNGEERPELKLSSHGRKVQKFGRPTIEIEGLVAITGISLLIACSLDTGDRRLISTFVERWHKETSSFHLPIGELTITLDDMASLLQLPIICAFHSFNTFHGDKAVLMLVDFLEFT